VITTGDGPNLRLNEDINCEKRERRIYLPALAVLALLLVVPIWLVTYPGMVDYPNHLTRCYIMAHYAGHPEFMQRYTISLFPLPNLGIDLIVTNLARFLPILLAGRISSSAQQFLYGSCCFRWWASWVWESTW
jgi:hypothetical protein